MTALETFTKNLTKSLEDKRKVLVESRKVLEGLDRELVRLYAANKISEASETGVKAEGYRQAIERIEHEIIEGEKSLEELRNQTTRKDKIARLVQLGQEAAGHRQAYESEWQRIHDFIAKNAPGMVGAYSDWQSVSREFQGLLWELEPGTRSAADIVGNVAIEKAIAFAQDLSEQVDLGTVLDWPKSGINSVIHFEHPGLMDGPYVTSLDYAHEVTQYGQELLPSHRKAAGVRHTRGAMLEHWSGLYRERPYFPVMSEERRKKYTYQTKIDWRLKK